jgi:hypothetical protein
VQALEIEQGFIARETLSVEDPNAVLERWRGAALAR